MKMAAVHRFPDIHLVAEENPGKPRKPSDEGCAISHCFKWGP
jgi:hypothetical protein